MKIKNFKLYDQFGQERSLADYRGQWVVLYFYPRDNTPGCTLEAQGFKNLMPRFSQQNAIVLGVSDDPVKSHEKFAEKQKLNFPILSDRNHQVIDYFGAWGTKKIGGKEFGGTLRQTVLINPAGELAKKWEEVKPATHPQEVLEEIRNRI